MHINLTSGAIVTNSMRNSDPITIDRKLEILHNVINRMVDKLEDETTALKPSVGDLIRLLEMETELAGRLTPQKTIIQWMDPYLCETTPEIQENPSKAG